ncbi:MAG: LCP family protein [Lachnospiraceae bacterium]|nr:LCP family protein [Lachnospiraceae bacterium]
MDIKILTNEEKKKTTKRRIQIAVLSVCIVLCCLFSGSIAVYLYIFSSLDKMNYVEDPVDVVINPHVEIEEQKNPDELEGSSIDSIEQQKIDQALQENLSKGLVYNSHVTNILLVGTDWRVDYDWAGNSDSMILVSINNNTHEIVLTSIMRDTYVTIPDYGNYKINLAHALGGAPKLVETIEANFGIDISYYASVNFNSFISIIDIMGGIPMYVSPEEVRVANQYIDDMYDEGDITEHGDYLPEEGGNLYLTGTQALAFSRIRYVGNSDYERTERQRRVLEEVVAKAKKLSFGQLHRIINEVTPYITHNIPSQELMNLVLMAPTLLGYELISDRLPYDDMYQIVIINGQDMLIPDWPSTIERFYGTIYRNVSEEEKVEDALKRESETETQIQPQDPMAPTVEGQTIQVLSEEQMEAPVPEGPYQ